jgi:hypothetical protein
VDDGGAIPVERFGIGVDDAAVDAATLEFSGKKQPSGTGADDEDFDVSHR